MRLAEFEDKLQDLRAKNGWVINLEFNGVWVVHVYDKETGDLIGCTGTTGLIGVLAVLQNPQMLSKEA